MSEETTEKFKDKESFEARVLSELSRISSQMTTGFAAFDSRLTSMEGRLAVIDSRLDSIEQRLTALEGRVDVLDGRLTSLEVKVDARLHDTRPIWEAVLSRLKVIDKKLDLFAKDMMELRAEVELLKERIPSAA